jgi:hypothetical protein
MVFSSAEPSGLRGRREGSRPRPLLTHQGCLGGVLAWQKSEIDLFVMAITAGAGTASKVGGLLR